MGWNGNCSLQNGVFTQRIKMGILGVGLLFCGSQVLAQVPIEGQTVTPKDGYSTTTVFNIWKDLPYWRNPLSPVEEPRLVIYKRERIMEVYDGDTHLKTYPIQLGFPNLPEERKTFHPLRPKQTKKDFLTPEGVFYIVDRRDMNQVEQYGFLGISYPTVRDALRLYFQNRNNPRITAKAKQIYSAVRNLQRDKKREYWNGVNGQLWDTSLGGSIGLHGGADRNMRVIKNNFPMNDTLQITDGTNGCIGFQNKDMDEIRAMTQADWDGDKPSVPILIVAEREELRTKQERFLEFLKNPEPFMRWGTLDYEELQSQTHVLEE